jgi:hypothetical protein
MAGGVRVAVDRGPIRLHSLDHPRIGRGGGLIIKVNPLEVSGPHIILSLSPLAGRLLAGPASEALTPIESVLYDYAVIHI